MSINISAFAGAGAQFFDANGAPLTGGLLYTYLAGTTTNAVTFTSRTGSSNNTNPIVLDAAGRTPAEIWMTGGSLYKFVLKDSTFVQIGSYDNIPAINDVTTVNSLITVAGTNTLTGLDTPSLAAYAAGAQFSFVAQNTNTAAVTLDIDTLGAKSVTKYGTTPLIAGDLVAGSIALIEYDGTRFQLINPVPDFTDRLTTSIKTSAFAAVATNTYAVNTTAGAIIATLPASPVAGDYMTFTDYARTFSTYGLTLNPNGNKINGNTSNIVLNTSGEAVSIVYIDAAQGWLCYSGFISNPIAYYTGSYLMTAGGGGGSYANGGGGGAGGLLSGSSITFTSGTSFPIVIGAGGAGGVSGTNPTAGSNTTFNGLTTIGGGQAGQNNGATGSGGSGGGSNGQNSSLVAGGAGTSGQGNAGGQNYTLANYGAGAGGGAGAVGAGGQSSASGAGGIGVASLISGASVYYAGGGGGGQTVSGASAGAGGNGGGGAGGTSGNGTSGTMNTGGGGGGGGGASGNGGAGGSGVVIISYLGSQRGTGGVVTNSGGYTIHTFIASGTYIA